MRYFNLTVNKDGVVSLWDDFDKAENGKQPGEIVVLLALTEYQQDLLKRAQSVAS